MIHEVENPIVEVISRMVSPFIMLFALYVIFHGHYSPGGGFQGGTMLAAALLLMRISSGTEIASRFQFKRGLGTIFGSCGVFIYFGTGLLCMLLGGRFLQYEYLTKILPVTKIMARYWGILIVEIGVGIAVMGLLVAIYDDLVEGEP